MLFKKRENVQSDSDIVTASASKEETVQAIKAVLRVRQHFLRSKGISNMRHIMDDPERKQFAKLVRDSYEQSDLQLQLQAQHTTKWNARVEARAKAGLAKGTGGKGKGGKGKGTGLKKFLHKQKRKRFHRHSQRVVGSKQIWEVLSFTGSFRFN